MNKGIYPLISWDWYRIIYFSLLALPRFATKQERGENTAWGKTSQALLHSASILTLTLILGLWTRVSHWTISGAGRAAFLGLKLDWPWRRLSVLRQSLSMQLWLVWNLLCSQADPEQRDLLNSASWMLGLRHVPSHLARNFFHPVGVLLSVSQRWAVHFLFISWHSRLVYVRWICFNMRCWWLSLWPQLLGHLRQKSQKTHELSSSLGKIDLNQT